MASSPIQVDPEAPLIIGLFKHEDSSAWAMVVNRDLHKPGIAATYT